MTFFFALFLLQNSFLVSIKMTINNFYSLLKFTVMTIIGRITKDAVVNTLEHERKVVNFSIAVNESYRPKGGEVVKLTTYFNCAYWISDKIADKLKKSTLVEVTGRLFVKPYVGADGNPKASLNCHVSSIKIHAWPKDTTPSQVASPVSDDEDENLPF
jgi:single-strand DNA-binding protein